MSSSMNRAGWLAAAFVLIGFWGQASADTLLVPGGTKTQWQYLDDGSDQGIAWRAPAFDDTSWRRGAAPLGYGDPEVVTRVRFGKDPQRKHITTYFRHHFDVRSADFRQLLFRIRSDDGIVLCLNGKEVLRNNLPTGEVGSLTTAINALNDVDERLWRHFVVPGEILHAGQNVLAVEVHQAQAVSTDLFLDLELRAYGSADELRPIVDAKARTQSEAFLKGHRIEPGQSIVDGFMDGGRSSTIDAAGLIASSREVIVVDRSRGPRRCESTWSLPARSNCARWPRWTGPPCWRCMWIGSCRTRPARNGVKRPLSCCKASITASRFCWATYPGCAGPACAGIVPRCSSCWPTRPASGPPWCAARSRSVGRPAIHDWNELQVGRGYSLIVDVSVLPPTVRFPDIPKGEGKRYRTVADQPMYGQPEKKAEQRTQ